MFQLSTDGILQYEAHRLCYVFSNVPVNQLYDRYNAAQDVQYCVKYRCKTLSVASVERLSQFAAAQPSVAKAMEGILRTLRCTPLVFACAKKSTDGIPDGLPSVDLAKDGGGYKKDLKNSLDLKIGKVFQE